MTTLTQRIEAVGAFAKVAWWWLAIAGLGLGALFLVRSCNRADRAEAELARVTEAVALERAGFVVAQRETQSQLEEATSKVPALQAEIDRLTKQLGRKPKIVTVERLVTAPSPATGVPRPAPLPGAPCPDCMFAAGDTGQIRVDSAHVETSKENEVVAMSAECWRLTPTESLILSGVASAPLSRVSVLTPPSTPGWGAGLAGGLSIKGALGSAVVVSPQFFGHMEGIGLLTAGPDLAAVQLGVVYRP